MTPTTWAVFAVTEIVLCLSPGPAVMFVVSQGLAYGRRPALAANAGILTGNGFYFLASALGLGALIAASHSLFVVLKWVGVAYLVYLGVKMIATAGKGGPVAADATPPQRVFRRGVLLQLANPKALVFFTALLPQFVDPSGTVWLQLLILGVTGTVIEFIILAGYGMLAGRLSALARRPRFAAWTDRVSGGLLIGAGAGLAAASD